ncbi:MAG: manganese transporter [Phycisphaerales bacterium]|nr:manganese transporter [Phycisphaerales bacterium]
MATFANGRAWVTAALALLILIAQLGWQQSAAKLQIVATTGMIGDMVQRIVGDRADVTTLMGEGVDPHLYKVTVSDVRALADADVVIANGLMLEGRMGDVFAKLRRRGRLVIEAGASLTQTQLLHSDGSHGHPDPHIWMDPTIWSQCAAHVADELSVRDPANASLYRANVAALGREWIDADRAIAQAIASVEPKRRVLVTAHDAFAYFGRRYGVEVTGIQGISTESESGLDDIRRLIDLLVTRNVPAVFVETSVSDKNVLALVEGARARDHTIIIGGSLYSDAMGEAGTPQGTYTGMIKKNAHTIVAALGGDAHRLTTSPAESEGNTK